MTAPLAISLIQNTAILLSFSMFYDYLWAREEDEAKSLLQKLVAGLIVGGIGFILMLTPWTVSSGLIFDTRTILLSISGLFLGPIPTLIGVLITGLYRLYLGGDGLWMGLSSIVFSGLIGIFWGIWRPGWQKGNVKFELLVMGLLVHLVMLASVFLLPREHTLKILGAIFLPIVFIYVPGTTLLGLLMKNRTENWKNKRALRNTQALYASLVEQMPAGVFRKSSEGRYDFVNERFCEWKGLTEGEILGKTPQELIKYVAGKEALGAGKPRSRQILSDSFGQEHHRLIMTYGKPIVVEEEYPQPDGSIEYSQVVKTPVFDGDHKVIGSQGMLFDITLQKQLQVELIRAKDRAEDSDRLKTAFLHNISHEIRTPMNAIVGFSGFLNEENLTPDKSKIYTEVIVQSSRQLLSIIDDIVRIATIEAGQETIKEVDFQLNVLCTLAYQQFADEAEKAGIEFRLRPGLSDQGDWILTDQTKILEVFSNLLVNALKFTKQGHVCLGYELKGETLEFFVEDTGVGIRKELQDDIFKRFRQADSTLSRQFGGSGLGLSICKAYIELLGGRIWVDSEVGVGSVFRFTIPYKKSTMNKNVELLSSCEGERTDSESKQYSVLVAEDEDLNFILLREILSPLDMSVVRAINGKEAVDMVKKRKDIDLVLMDLKMPVMDGYEAAALIKEECPTLPILALTAYSHESDKRRAYACGCSDFISKPFRKADLIEKMKLHLHQA